MNLTSCGKDVGDLKFIQLLQRWEVMHSKDLSRIEVEALAEEGRLIELVVHFKVLHLPQVRRFLELLLHGNCMGAV